MNTPKAVVAVVGVLALAACGAPTDNQAAGVNDSTVTYRTPKACLTALSAAEAILQGPVVDEGHDFIHMTRLVEKAYLAGATGVGLDVVTVEVKGITRSTVANTSKVKALANVYRPAAAACRAAAH